MKYSPTLLAFAALLAIVYGVSFSVSYPHVEISGGIVALCVLMGILTCLAVAAIWSALARPRTASTDPVPPAAAASPKPPASRTPPQALVPAGPA